MKVAFVSLMNGVEWGGSEELWYRTAKLAMAKGHSIATLTRQWKKIPDKIVELQNLGSDAKFFYRPSYTLLDRAAIKLKLKSYKTEIIPDLPADVYVISNGSTFDFLYNREVCNYIVSQRKPYVLINQHNFENGGLLDEVHRAYSIDIFQKAERSFFVSERNLRTAERQIAAAIENAELISNPLNIKQPVIRPFPESQTLLMACVARLDCSFKGQDILLQVLHADRWKDRDFRLKLYGAGPHEAYLKHLIEFYGLQDKVSMQGHVHNIDQVWETNQLLVLPSLSEGTPLALMEAMLSGRTAVATDVGDNGRYVLDGETGFLAHTASFNCLTESLEELWMNRGNLMQFGKNAFHHSLEITNLHPEASLLNFIEGIN